MRDRDGRPHSERFHDAAAYRARLVSLEPSENGGISIEQIAEFLDT